MGDALRLLRGKKLAGEVVAEDGAKELETLIEDEVLLKVLRVVCVTADALSTRLPVALGEEPYGKGNWDVCSESLGRLEGGI